MDAFLYSGSGPMQDLGAGWAYGINDSGQVAGYTYTSGLYEHGFRTVPGQPINLATDDLGTLGGNTRAAAINNSGQVVGLSDVSGGYEHAFRTAPNQPINPATDDLGTLGGWDSVAEGINQSGQVVGWADTGGYDSSGDAITHAFRHTGSGANPATDDLGTLAAPYNDDSTAAGINRSGQVVGYAFATSGAGHAFLYSNGAMQDLGTLATPYNYSIYAFAINDSGQIVGSAESSSESGHAFLYGSNGLMQDLNSLIPSGSGWTLESAAGHQ